MTPDPNRLQSVRGRIQPPNLDDRTWQDLVDQMQALIPRYAPRWTDHNPSDLGMTLIELFAWLAEQVIYRLNRVPEKNYIAFLNLLGIVRDPATPARTYLTFFDGKQLVTVQQGTQVQTAGSETDSPIVFETDDSVTVLPTDLKAVLWFEDDVTYRNVTRQLTEPPTSRLTLTLKPGTMPTLCLGFSAATAEAVRLLLHLARPVRVRPGATSGEPPVPEVEVSWFYPEAGKHPLNWSEAVFSADAAPANPQRAVEQWRESGAISFSPPAAWPALLPTDWQADITPAPATPSEDAVPAVSTPLHWVAVRFTNPLATTVTLEVDQVLFNTVSARNALSVTEAAPDVFTGTGQPYQRYTLRHHPLLVEPGSVDPYRWLRVTVGTAPADGPVWRPVDEFLAAEDDVFRISMTTGELQFGNYDDQTKLGRGTIPPAGSTITVTYRYVGGGANGNVGAGTLAVLTNPPDEVRALRVHNLTTATGGSDEEPIEETLRRAPDELRTHSRAVTVEDYEFLAREASTDVARAFCLTPRNNEEGQPWQYANVDRSPGKVTVIVVPHTGPDADRPRPSTELLREVQAYLDRRRDLTADLTVRGPLYLPVTVTATVTLFGRLGDTGADPEALKRELTERVTAFLHPVTGGADGRGWSLGQRVQTSALFTVMMPRADVGYISDLKVAALLPEYLSSPVIDLKTQRPVALGEAGPSVRVTDYELVCSAPTHTIIIEPEQP